MNLPPISSHGIPSSPFDVDAITHRITVPDGAAKLLNAKLYHGTALEQCSGVLGGAKKGIGCGLRHKGVYFAVNDEGLASVYAGISTEFVPRGKRACDYSRKTQSHM